MFLDCDICLVIVHCYRRLWSVFWCKSCIEILKFSAGSGKWRNTVVLCSYFILAWPWRTLIEVDVVPYSFVTCRKCSVLLNVPLSWKWLKFLSSYVCERFTFAFRLWELPTWRFNVMFTRDLQWSIYYSNSLQIIRSTPISLKFILILSSHLQSLLYSSISSPQ